MHVLVAYATHLGSTREIAERIAQTMREEGVEVALSSVEEVDDVARFDAFVVGSAVHAGHWLKPATQFVEHNASVLAGATWLFSSGPIGDEAASKPQPDPKEIEDFARLFTSRDHVIFGGAFDRATANAAGGMLDRVFSRFIPEGDYRDWPQIESWARGIARELSGVAAAT